jgi:serine/threonine protein kinase
VGQIAHWNPEDKLERRAIRVVGMAGVIETQVPPPTGSLAPGLIVADKYQLTQPLGTGGMGVVWAARHADSGALLALKFLRPGPGGMHDQDSVKRFLREARAAASVSHPHVVAIRDVLELDDGSPVMVMEMLIGETLRKHLSRKDRLSLEETARILLPVVSAVGTAHHQGIVHRDLKPDNIFLSVEPGGATVVKVLDFGIARITQVEGHGSGGVGLTASGDMLGTPNYMSPEQVFGERDIDQRADIWALGVVLYECLSGVLPTKAANLGQVFKLIVAGGIKPLSAVLPDAPPEVCALVDAMLARRRDQRPGDLIQISQLLARHTTVVVPAIGEPRIPRRRVDEPSPNADETLRRLGGEVERGFENTVQKRRRRLSRLTTVGLGIFVVVVLVAESFLLWRNRSFQPVPIPAPVTTPATDPH